MHHCVYINTSLITDLLKECFNKKPTMVFHLFVKLKKNSLLKCLTSMDKTVYDI